MFIRHILYRFDIYSTSFQPLFLTGTAARYFYLNFINPYFGKYLNKNNLILKRFLSQWISNKNYRFSFKILKLTLRCPSSDPAQGWGERGGRPGRRFWEAITSMNKSKYSHCRHWKYFNWFTRSSKIFFLICGLFFKYSNYHSNCSLRRIKFQQIKTYKNIFAFHHARR